MKKAEGRAVKAAPVSSEDGLSRRLGPGLMVLYGDGVMIGAGVYVLMGAVAALNGVLAQILMASRMLFGLGRSSAGPAFFHHVSPRWHTPLRATLLVGDAVIAAAPTMPVARLASWMIRIILITFMVVSLSLIWLKRKQPEARPGVPLFIPWLGAMLSLAVLVASWGGTG